MDTFNKVREVDVNEYFNVILSELKKGVLLSSKHGSEVNTMTISWGKIGIEWNKLIFTAYVRTGRHTHELIEKSGVFGINVPYGNKVNKILGYCGTHSGKHVDKIKQQNLSLVPGLKLDVPGIKELPLTLECKVVYKQLQNKDAIGNELKSKFYPSDKDSDFHGANKDYHTMFYGEIISAYIIE